MFFAIFVSDEKAEKYFNSQVKAKTKKGYSEK
jgi:hypothetical protein